jgi:type IV secretion system protein VirB8
MALFKREVSEASRHLIKQSIDFEANTITMVRRSERRAWIVAFVSMGICLCLVAGIAYMLPLKEKVPYLVTVDLKRSSSTVSFLRDDIAVSGIYASEALNRSYVARFVQAREGYDWDTINEHDWEYVASMSNDTVKGVFVAQFDDTPGSPEKKWGRNTAIRVKVNSVVFHGLDEERGTPPTGGTVRFERWKFDKTTGKSDYMSSHVATLRYEYKNHLKMSDNLRLRNPLGFQVTAYKVDDEFNAPVFKPGEGAKGLPLLNADEGIQFRGAPASGSGSQQVNSSPTSSQPVSSFPGAPSTTGAAQ